MQYRQFGATDQAVSEIGFGAWAYEVAMEAIDEIRRLVPVHTMMAQFSLRWILMEEAVSTVIPGAKNATQAQNNSSAGMLAAIPQETMDALREIYQNRIAPYVHQLW